LKSLLSQYIIGVDRFAKAIAWPLTHVQFFSTIYTNISKVVTKSAAGTNKKQGWLVKGVQVVLTTSLMNHFTYIPYELASLPPPQIVLIITRVLKSRPSDYKLSSLSLRRRGRAPPPSPLPPPRPLLGDCPGVETASEFSPIVGLNPSLISPWKSS